MSAAQETCARCGHRLIMHTFLMADMDRCHWEGCDCPAFVYVEEGGGEELAAMPLTPTRIQVSIGEFTVVKRERLVFVKIGYGLLKDFLLGRLRPAMSDLPEDVEIVDVGNELWDRTSGQVSVVLSSMEFAPVPAGQMIPHRDVTFTAILPTDEEIEAEIDQMVFGGGD